MRQRSTLCARYAKAPTPARARPLIRRPTGLPEPDALVEPFVAACFAVSSLYCFMSLMTSAIAVPVYSPILLPLKKNMKVGSCLTDSPTQPKVAGHWGTSTHRYTVHVQAQKHNIRLTTGELVDSRCNCLAWRAPNCCELHNCELGLCLQRSATDPADDERAISCSPEYAVWGRRLEQGVQSAFVSHAVHILRTAVARVPELCLSASSSPPGT
eukprot:scaffold5725_cov387-Prasinococcus_capsulatus_cf.AAC.8